MVTVFLFVSVFGGLINVITNFCLGSSLVICNAKMCFVFINIVRDVMYAHFVISVVMSSLLFACCGFLEVRCCVCMANNISFTFPFLFLCSFLSASSWACELILGLGFFLGLLASIMPLPTLM